MASVRILRIIFALSCASVASCASLPQAPAPAAVSDQDGYAPLNYADYKFPDKQQSNRPIVQALMTPTQNDQAAGPSSAIPTVQMVGSYGFSDRECLARAMYFEGRPTDHASLLAVGTIIANRSESHHWPSTWCGVVAQQGQFTSDPLNRQVDKNYQIALTVADEIFAGSRDPNLKGVFNFHTTGYNSGFIEKRVASIGGNTFYKLFNQ